jgi:predicted MFS family arabinose efflux permease
MGPLLGSVLYSFGGYRFTFYSFGILFIAFAFFVRLIFPPSVDEHSKPSKNFEKEGD